MPDDSKAPENLNTHRPGPAELIVAVASIGLLVALIATKGESRSAAPPDFAAMEVDLKKREFFAYLSPIVSTVNFEMTDTRERVRRIKQEYDDGTSPGWLDRRWLKKLAAKLEVPLDDLDLAEALRLLERRAGIVPESIVLAQAAIESGWGTSRFALEGNNYFGQRCYSDDCGIVPMGIADEASFGLAEFASVAASVESYILNINTHPQYEDFRALRHALRSNGTPITGLALVDGLLGYSERGEEYIADIEAMIRSNNLE